MTDENESKAPSDLTFKYRWGTERPLDRGRRLHKARLAAVADRHRRVTDHLKDLERIDREIELIDAQLMEVEILALGGRYDRDQELKLRALVRHMTPDGNLPGPDLRKRGRPAKSSARKRVGPSRAKKL